MIIVIGLLTGLALGCLTGGEHSGSPSRAWRCTPCSSARLRQWCGRPMGILCLWARRLGRASYGPASLAAAAIPMTA